MPQDNLRQIKLSSYLLDTTLEQLLSLQGVRRVKKHDVVPGGSSRWMNWITSGWPTAEVLLGQGAGIRVRASTQVHTQLGQPQSGILPPTIASTRFSSNILDPPSGEPNRPARCAPLRRFFTTNTQRPLQVGKAHSPHLRVPQQLNRRTARRGRPVRDWPRAPLAAGDAR